MSVAALLLSSVLASCLMSNLKKKHDPPKFSCLSTFVYIDDYHLLCHSALLCPRYRYHIPHKQGRLAFYRAVEYVADLSSVWRCVKCFLPEKFKVTLYTLTPVGKKPVDWLVSRREWLECFLFSLSDWQHLNQIKQGNGWILFSGRLL